MRRKLRNLPSNIPSKMCTYCAHVLVGFTIRHSEEVCPLRKSMYCRHCATYGHISATCSRKPSAQYTAPVDPSRLPPAPAVKESSRPIVELKNVDSVIREYLRNQGFEGSLKRRELRSNLADFAKAKKIDIRIIE
jgi:hypothetical protein